MRIVFQFNCAYVDLAANLMCSLKRVGMSGEVTAVAVGPNAKIEFEHALQNANVPCCEIMECDGVAQKQLRVRTSSGLQSDWVTLTHNKLAVVHSFLMKEESVCLLDADVVVLHRDWLDTALAAAHGVDMACASDMRTEGSDLLNTGVCIFHPTPACLRLLQPELYCRCGDDQDYINSVRSELCVKVLPLSHFAHFNFVESHGRDLQWPNKPTDYKWLDRYGRIDQAELMTFHANNCLDKISVLRRYNMYYVTQAHHYYQPLR